ncbi:MAG: hypothetical protein K9L17_12355 [Clostridiales bacterium]|nr:hypothetical protein [Clostridiales bacterium]MCF8023474.1 hypothetical protein [Clostridiales bacterium]
MRNYNCVICGIIAACIVSGIIYLLVKNIGSSVYLVCYLSGLAAYFASMGFTKKDKWYRWEIFKGFLGCYFAQLVPALLGLVVGSPGA